MHSNLIQQRLPLRCHEEIGIPPHGLPLGGQPHAQFDSLLRDIVHREVQMAMGLVVGLCHLVFLPPSFPMRKLGFPRMACRWEDSHMPNLTPSSVT